MAAQKLLILALTCVSSSTQPQYPLESNITIFGDELLHEGISSSTQPQDPLENNITIFGDELLYEAIYENRQLFSNKQLSISSNVANYNLYRLPGRTKPIHYNIFWGVNFNSTPQSFSGRVEIQIEATEADVSEIVIHSDGLNIEMVLLMQGEKDIPVSVEDETYFQFLRIELESGSLDYKATDNTVYTLNIMFSAPLRDDMQGFYKSWFRNQPSDPISWLAITQSQPMSARKVFPCYDEPGFKATFDIYIRRPANYKSWCNTRINYSTDSPNEPDHRDDIYHTTPLMSTYLIAIVFAQYDSLPIYNNNNEIIYEVVARPNAISTDQGRYALDVGQELLKKMSSHTNYDFYSIDSKLQITHVAIPDFSYTAMENWGLLSYRESNIMYDPVHSNNFFKQKIARMMSHDISHQWFGNLVTCDWWGDLWLQKGFARYYEYFLTHWVETYMGMDTRFVTEQVLAALAIDSDSDPHPLSKSRVGSPKDVNDMYSTITYSKGAAIIRQTEHLLGHEVHTEGLRKYLMEYKFKNVKPINLFESLQAAGAVSNAFSQYGQSFSFVDYYKSWTEREGHPLLAVEVNHNSGDMIIRRHRFNIKKGVSKINGPTIKWIIPITFSSASDPDFDNTKPTHIINQEVTIINRGSKGLEWVLLNKQHIGFYRVNYDNVTWGLITDALRGPDRIKIHEHNRAQIVNDVFQFARSGLLSYTKAFTILSFLEFETSYSSWVTAISGFSWLRNRLAGTSLLALLETLIVRWARTVMGHLTYYPSSGEDFMKSFLRYQLAPMMCELNQDSCRQAAVAQFNKLRDYQEEVPPDSRPWVYCNALREGTVEDFNFLLKRYLEHNVCSEKRVLLKALGCTPHKDSLLQLLGYIIDSENTVRSHDYVTVLTNTIEGNEENTQIVFKWIQENLKAVISKFGEATAPLQLIPPRLRTLEEVSQFQKWLADNIASSEDAYNDLYIESARAQKTIRWAARVAPDIRNFLEPYLADTAVPTLLSSFVFSFTVIINLLL